MNFYRTFLAVMGLLLVMPSAQATVISGTATGDFFGEGGGGTDRSPIKFGDGVHSVTIFWEGSRSYGANFLGTQYFESPDLPPITYSEVAFAVGVTDISQVTDASIFSFGGYVSGLCDAACDPDGVGDFVVARNVLDGYYGVFRVDKMDLSSVYRWGSVRGTWWFQTDGTGNFASAIPEPSSYLMFGIGMMVLLGYRVRDFVLIKSV